MPGTHRPGLRVALIYEPREAFLAQGYTQADCADLPHAGEIEAIGEALRSLGHDVSLVPGIGALVRELAGVSDNTKAPRPWDLAFNMAEGFHGSAREAQVPSLLEAYSIPCTFSSAATLSLCLDKAKTKVR